MTLEWLLNASHLCEVILVCKHKTIIVGLGAKDTFRVCRPAQCKKSACAMDVALLTATVNLCILFHVRQIFP